MAFGIDDGISAAAASISLTQTFVEVVRKYRKDSDFDIELLIEQVRVEALKRIDQADSALAEFEELLEQKGVNPDKNLNQIIKETPFWNATEQWRLRKIRKSIQALSESVYDASDDISALVRCKQKTEKYGEAVIETGPRKHEFHQMMLNAPTLKQKIKILRNEMLRQKNLLM